MRRGVDLLREQNVLYVRRAVQDCAGRGRSPGGRSRPRGRDFRRGAGDSDRPGFRAFETELHRARGDILLKRDPANPAPAEDAFLTAIAVAKQQGTRSFGCAPLALAKLYRSTSRPSMPTPSSRRRSKAFRRPRKCPRSPRRRRCWRLSRPPRMRARRPELTEIPAYVCERRSSRTEPRGSDCSSAGRPSWRSCRMVPRVLRPDPERTFVRGALREGERAWRGRSRAAFKCRSNGASRGLDADAAKAAANKGYELSAGIGSWP